MKQSKTKLIVAIIAIIVVIIAIVAGVMLYLTTDLFKGNDQLFFKYLLKNNEMIEMFAEDNTKTLTETIKQNKYTTNSEITFNLESNDPQIANQAIPAANFSIKTAAKADPTNNRASSETTLKFLDKDLFTLKYIRDNDSYALKSDEVVNKYLALENNNLKEFASKLGVTDTTAVPNKIVPISLEELLFISERDKKEMLEKYMQVVNVQISKDKYKAEKNVTTTVNEKSVTANAYSLELTQKETIDLLVAMLETLKTDETTLNIILEKVKLLDNQSTITVDNLKDGIQDVIDELNNVQTREETIKLTLYANDGELLKTEITGGGQTISVDYEKNDTSIRMVVVLEGMETNNTLNLKKIEFAKQAQTSENNMFVIITFGVGEEVVKVSAQSKTNVGDNIQNNTVVNVNITDNTYFTAKINSTTTPSTDVEVEQLTKQNSAKINDFTPQYMASLSQSIVKRLQTLFTQKLQIIATAQMEENNGATQNGNSIINSDL